ncbi:MAG: hypothetical protein ACYDBJ_09100 [Aggregatilineales bacterium]
MTLEKSEVNRFYSVWVAVLYFVNQRLKLVRSFPEKWTQKPIPGDLAYKLREAFWADDTLRQVFLAENPAKLSADDLAMAASWEYHIKDHFFIYRHLRKYSVFLGGKTSTHVYGVIGLNDSIRDIVGPALPIYIETVILPFEDRIIYDGLFVPYSVFFGGGIRSDLDEDYRRAKEREGIITALPFKPDSSPSAIQARHKALLKDFQKELGRAGLNPKMVLQHVGAIEAFVQSENFDPTHNLLDFQLSDAKTFMEQPDANPVSLKRFIVFLRDTGRITYPDAKTTLDWLKRQRQADQ